MRFCVDPPAIDMFIEADQQLVLEALTRPGAENARPRQIKCWGEGREAD